MADGEPPYQEDLLAGPLPFLDTYHSARPYRYRVNWTGGQEQQSAVVVDLGLEVTGLQPGEKYYFTVATLREDGCQSTCVEASVITAIPIPEHLTGNSITASSPSLSWLLTPDSFLVSYQSEGNDPESISTEPCSAHITGLKPGTELTIRVKTELQSDQIKTGNGLPELLSALGLRDLHGGKLTLSSVLEINRNTVSDEPAQSLEQLPWNFLKRLMKSNLNARNINYADAHSEHAKNLNSAEPTGNYIAMNPLDLITALFYCSDPFLQQEMVSKMSMCQFAVPLLLPNCDTQQCTLMLWAMRDLVKKYKPHSGDKAFVEGMVVEMDIPMVSFIRLGKSSLPKSQILNKLISNPHQHNDTFVHRDMDCGNVPRRVSDGLVEVSWYLPCGNPNIDMFTQPMAIANLRGDARLFKSQMSFLCQTSAAVFIFSDDLDGDLSTLTNTESKAELFLLTNSQRENFNMATLKDACRRLNINVKNRIIKNRQNDVDLAKSLRVHVRGLIEKNPYKLKVESMVGVAHDVGIQVDEDSTECRNGRLHAEGITKAIEDVVTFKKKQLPLHGDIWKEISQLEKERCRMRNAGTDTEHYLSQLKSKEKALREKQLQFNISDAMVKFTAGISQSGKEHLYFLKWLKMLLDTLCRRELSTLRQQCKECSGNTPQDKELIAHLKEQISNCSLGLEHFFRELGQLYECARSLPENNPDRNKYQHLPALCAQMLLDGFPIELVDGDASNIPMKWISAVLTQLHQLVDSKSRILVLTVLGVQGTGKSTLLNTMFGVQFAVSSERCTRGAFMLLIKVSEEFRSELDCDFVIVIDTEGLKSPASYEHNNELATLVIGLSDITIINVAMENFTEMKDILQIVVHASLKMKEVGKKPRCVFVHKNMSDMSAHDSNMRDEREMVKQLDKMTQKVAKMEKREANTKFSDIMEYDPDEHNYYIPGLWHGTPPMAPVSTGYSEAVYELKRSLINSVKMSDDIKSNDATEFLKWTEGLWNAVKFENFIFNFRNSLMAEAYSDLCTQYNTWEWSFQNVMNNWLKTKETELSNFGVTEQNVQGDGLRGILKEMLDEGLNKLDEEEKKILANLEKYFEKKDRKVCLVKKYKQDFWSDANSLRQQTESVITQSLEKAVEIIEGTEVLNKVKEAQVKAIERNIKELQNKKLCDDELAVEFEKMWEGITSELSKVSLPKRDAYQDVLNQLKSNLRSKSGDVDKMLSTINLKSSEQEEFIVKSDWFSNWESWAKRGFGAIRDMDKTQFIAKIQDVCDSIINSCEERISDFIDTMNRNNADYNETYIKKILKNIDDQTVDKITDECGLYLKHHVGVRTAENFQTAHKEFNVRNDPQKRLTEFKLTIKVKLESFSDEDHCKKKATEFIETFVKVAVQDYVSKELGQAIEKEIKEGDRGTDFNTQANFQFALLKHLLESDTFEKYKDYTSSHETFVKDWIKQQIIEKSTAQANMTVLEKHLLSKILQNIKNTITNCSKSEDLSVFIQQFCDSLKNKLIFQKDALQIFMILNNAKPDQFATNLIDLIKDMEESLTQEYDNKTGIEHITERIDQLPTKPHELLFTTLCGCGHHCPFCHTPCEAKGAGHREHFSSLHRPSAFGEYRDSTTRKLITDICTTLVKSDMSFKNLKTNNVFHPYKDYRHFYLEWQIAADSSLEASDYWKYVLMRFNDKFAEAYNAKPADIPSDWKTLTPEDALKSLEKAFNKN
ncbi:interferon-induced very large GTPase 1-like [Alosa alosa]|uniref:interferon-induced very large GTPase 1-like n=1 Tax=Alosa alosa TaxID=278164 RepID=UPI00201507FB|nr:interferon-induced very large GTPase 1-like [Alosa alosa]